MKLIMRLLPVLFLSFVILSLSITVKASDGDIENIIFNFIVYGDSRGTDYEGGMHRRIVDAYLQYDPEFVIHTGDMVNTGENLSSWELFNQTIMPVLEADIYYYGVIGNHEQINDPYFSNYLAFFDLPGNERWYSFNFQDLHFIVLNTQEDLTYDEKAYNCSAKQMDWLIADLNETEVEDFVIVAFHIPPFSVNLDRPVRENVSATVRDDFHDLFVQYDVDLVFNGHDHYYYRTVRDGIYYVVTGGGGASLYGVNKTSETWQIGDIGYKEHHFCNISVNATHIRVEAIKQDGTLLDSFLVALEMGEETEEKDFPFIQVGILIVGTIIAIAFLLYIRKRL